MVNLRFSFQLLLQRPSRASSGVRAWNFLLSVALKTKSVVTAKVLFSQFSLFVRCFQLSLRHHMQQSLGSQDMGAADINRAYVSIKLWLLLVRMFDSVQAGVVGGGVVHENSAKMIWNELWPSFETIVLSLENDALNGSVSVKHAYPLEQLIHSHPLRSQSQFSSGLLLRNSSSS